MITGRQFYNKELAEMVYEYLKAIFGNNVTLKLENGTYTVFVKDLEKKLIEITDVQKEFVRFLFLGDSQIF